MQEQKQDETEKENSGSKNEPKATDEQEKKANMFRDIFEFNEEELLEMMNVEHLMKHDYEEEKNNQEEQKEKIEELVENKEAEKEELFEIEEEEKEEPQIKFAKKKSLIHDEINLAKTINNTLFEQHYQEEPKAKNGYYNMQTSMNLYGSIPYGLPCLAITRRTLETQLKAKQVEMINEKICRIYQTPSEFFN